MAARYPTSWDDVPLIVDLEYVANLLRITPDRLKKLSIRGEFPAFKAGEKQWRVAKDDLRRYIEEHKVKTPSPAVTGKSA